MREWRTRPSLVAPLTFASVGSHAIGRPDKPHALACLTIRVDEHNSAGLQRAAHRSGRRPLQRVLPALKAANRPPTDLRAFGELVLGPVEQGAGGPTLSRRKGHAW